MIPSLTTSDELAVRAELAYEQAQSTDELALQKAIELCSEYFDGNQDVKLDERLKSILGDQSSASDPLFRLNVCRTVIRAVSERLSVTSFAVTSTSPQYAQAPLPNATPADDVRLLLAQIWERNKMNARAQVVHEQALARREHFVFVDWDAENAMPRFTLAPRYTSPQVGGNGDGCFMVYENNDADQKALYGVKVWTDTETLDGKLKARVRVNLYFPDRVEKYIIKDGKSFVPFVDETTRTHVVPWTDAQGNPLGIPLIHFRNANDRSEIWDAIPMQRAINHVLVDLLGASDLTVFRIYRALGFIPTTDGKPLNSDMSNKLTIKPASVVGTPKSPSEASFDAIDGADPRPIIELIVALMQWTAAITDTPVSRFQLTRQVSSAESQKEGTLPLLAKCQARQVNFGTSWSSVMSLALRLWNNFNSTQSFDDVLDIFPQWASAEVRDQKVVVETVAIERDKLRIPLVAAWKLAGHSDAEIAAWTQTEEYQLYIDALRGVSTLNAPTSA